MALPKTDPVVKETISLHNKVLLHSNHLKCRKSKIVREIVRGYVGEGVIAVKVHGEIAVVLKSILSHLKLMK